MQRPTPLNDYLPPVARSGEAASTPLGEVGGAQQPKAASTDGCQRRSAILSEGAAEREGCSAVLAAFGRCAPRNLGFTRVVSRAERLRAFEARHGSVRTLRGAGSECGEWSHSVAEVRIPLGTSRRSFSREVVGSLVAEREGFEPSVGF